MEMIQATEHAPATHANAESPQTNSSLVQIKVKDIFARNK